MEDIIGDTPNNVYSVAIGDGDNDGNNEVVIGLHSSSDEVRSYEKSGGSWVEDVIAGVPSHVWSVAIGDSDNDGRNEVVIGMVSTTDEVRAYEKITSVWTEDVIVDTLTDVFSVAIADANNDGNNEVGVGMWSTTNEVRLYEYDIGRIIFTSHKNGDYVSGTICFDVAVDSGSVKEVLFYLNNEVEHIDHSSPYQFILDTTTLTEDAAYTVKAEGIKNNGNSIDTVINITINNIIKTGAFITVDTLKTSYEPDQDVSVVVTTNSPPIFDSLNLVVNYVDPIGNTLYTKNESLPYAHQYIVGLPLFSDAVLGIYSIAAVAYGFDNGALIWNASDGTTFEVLGKNVHEQLKNINTQLSSMNFTLNDIQNMVTDMRSDLKAMNLTELVDAIYHLNQTLPSKIDDLSLQLSDVESSLTNQLTSILENVTNGNDTLRIWLENILAIIQSDLKATNDTLHIQLEDLKTTVDNFYTSTLNNLNHVFNSLSLLEENLSTQHITINNAITTLNDTISNTPNLSTGEITDKINDSIAQIQSLDDNMTIHDSDIKNILSSLGVLVENEHDLTKTELIENLSLVLSQLQDVDKNISSHDSDIKYDLTNLSDLISNLSALDISELNDKLSDLTSDVSEHDTAIGEEINAIDQSVGDIQNSIDEKLIAINGTLNGLGRIDDIINDLNELDQYLRAGEGEAISPKEEQGSNSTTAIVFLALMLIIFSVIIVVFLKEIRVVKESLGEVSGENHAFKRGSIREIIAEEEKVLEEPI